MYKTNWKAVRKVGNVAYQLKHKENDVEYSLETINGVECLITSPNEIKNNNVIYYIHGGGFVAGGAIGSKSFCSMLAAYSGSVVVACEYGLAPEHPFPDGFNDCVKVYKEIINRYDKLSIIGDSAGGNLTLGVTLKARELKIKTPSCVIVHSPVVDLSLSFPKSDDTNDFIVKMSCMEPLREMYCKDADTKRYELSPILGNFKKFPPLYITCASDETLRRDAEELYKKAIKNKVKAKLVIMDNAYHDYGTIGTSSPETKKIFDETIELIKETTEK